MSKRVVSGSISIFLALSITIMLSFCMVLIESARENAMLLKADMMFDTGMRCLMAEYHQKLWEKYDLVYMDCSYGSSMPDYGLVKSHLRHYVEENLKYDTKGWFALKYQECQMTDVLLATDMEGADFYLQAIKAAESELGISYVEQALSWLEQVESTTYISDVIEADSRNTEETIANVNGTSVEVEEAVWGFNKKGQPILIEEAKFETVDIHNPLDNILSGNILLKQVVNDRSNVSSNQINISSLASNRELSTGISYGSDNVDGMWKKALFCKYLLDHFGSYVDNGDLEQGGLAYSLEYLIGGKATDSQNLEVITAKLLAIREIDNYLALLQDEWKCAEAEVIGAAAASLVPWAGPIVTQGILIYWAYEDSVADLQRLFRGESVPLVKALGMVNASEFSWDLDYEDYLYLLLLMQGREKLTMRAMDMIEVDIREEQENFRMDGCISGVKFIGTFVDVYDKKYTITDSVQYY